MFSSDNHELLKLINTFRTEIISHEYKMYKIRSKLTNFVLIIKIISVVTQNSENVGDEKPNIILILADDMVSSMI